MASVLGRLIHWTRRRQGLALTDAVNPAPKAELLGALALTDTEPKHRLLDNNEKMDPKEIKQEKDRLANELGIKATDLCILKESPLRILRAASKGRLDEVQRLVEQDSQRLKIQDNKGRGCVHHAAKTGQVDVLQYLQSQGADLDLVDKGGLTPLMLAVEERQVKSVGFLIEHGADSTITDGIGQPPLHKAVYHGYLDIVQEMLKNNKVDVNIRGINGGSALHVAAGANHHECAQILLDRGARMCQPCDIGYMPIHVAAKSASHDALRVLLQFAQKHGCGSQRDIMKMLDNSKNMPLHSAIYSANLMAVEACLDAGASVLDQLEDRSTAVHMAAAQGSLDMVELMFRKQPDNSSIALGMTSLCGQTPLHRAALFDRAKVTLYLLEKGASINALDRESRTPVLLAASRRAWRTVNALLANGADSLVRDKQNRNILHLIIRNGGRPDYVKIVCNNNAMISAAQMVRQTLKDLMNAQDENGCTPLHYASEGGQLQTLETLLELGAVLNSKTHNMESPLHFAARYGRYETCRKLLHSSTGQNCLNEGDTSGNTPLHLAASEGHIRVIQLLLREGATILKNKDGDTALHLACRDGSVDAIATILNVHSYLLDQTNKDADTPIHLASSAGNALAVSYLLEQGAELTVNQSDQHFVDLAMIGEKRDVLAAVIGHRRWRECFTFESAVFRCPVAGLIHHVPDICMLLLDRCRTVSDLDRKSKDFHYKYDFSFLQMPHHVRKSADKSQKKEVTPLFALNHMVRFNRIECLSHPVVINFLKMKWRAYGMWFHILNLIIYLLFLVSLTAIVCTYHVPCRKPNNITNTSDQITPTVTTAGYNNTTEVRLGDSRQTLPVSWSASPRVQKLTMAQIGCVCIIMLFSSANIIKELGQMIHQKLSYFGDMINLLEWSLYVTSLLFVVPFLFEMNTVWQWQCGAAAAFLAWFNFLLILQSFDFYGIYVVMFLEILGTLVQALVVFSILFIAFGLAFFIIFNAESDTAFQTPGISMMSAVVMMTGTIEYMDTWVRPTYDESKITLEYPTLAYVILLLFVILMPILLMNLLIGLAVGDISSVQKDARLKRLAMQVQLHTDLEQKLPERFIEYVDKPVWYIYPNRKGFYSRIWAEMMKIRGTGDGEDEIPKSHHPRDSVVYHELATHGRQLEQLSAQVDKTYNLVRLMIQKMDIKPESDDLDEPEVQPRKSLWCSKAVKDAMVANTSVKRWRSNCNFNE